MGEATALSSTSISAPRVCLREGSCSDVMVGERQHSQLTETIGVSTAADLKTHTRCLHYRLYIYYMHAKTAKRIHTQFALNNQLLGGQQQKELLQDWQNRYYMDHDTERQQLKLQSAVNSMQT